MGTGSTGISTVLLFDGPALAAVALFQQALYGFPLIQAGEVIYFTAHPESMIIEPRACFQALEPDIRLNSDSMVVGFHIDAPKEILMPRVRYWCSERDIGAPRQLLVLRKRYWCSETVIEAPRQLLVLRKRYWCSEAVIEAPRQIFKLRDSY